MPRLQEFVCVGPKSTWSVGELSERSQSWIKELSRLGIGVVEQYVRDAPLDFQGREFCQGGICFCCCLTGVDFLSPSWGWFFSENFKKKIPLETKVIFPHLMARVIFSANFLHPPRNPMVRPLLSYVIFLDLQSVTIVCSTFSFLLK